MTGSWRASGSSRGSAVYMPRTSVKIWQRSASRAAASATPVVSEPPRPRGVTSERVGASWLWPWKAPTITTRPPAPPAVEACRIDPGDSGLAVIAVGRDPRLRPRECDRRHTERVQGHRDESGALVLARCEEHVELARIRLVGDGAGQGEQLIGRIAHRRHDDHEVGTRGTLARNACGDTPDPVGVGYGRAAEFLNDERFGHGGHSSRRKKVIP